MITRKVLISAIRCVRAYPQPHLVFPDGRPVFINGVECTSEAANLLLYIYRAQMHVSPAYCSPESLIVNNNSPLYTFLVPVISEKIIRTIIKGNLLLKLMYSMI